jgi:hypothetical protein
MAVRYSDDDVEEREYLPAYLAQLADDQPDDPEASGRTSCDACGHLRKVHSRIGCLEQGCTCAVTYMDL